MKKKNIFVLLAAITLVACSSNSHLNSSSINEASSSSAIISDSSNTPSSSSEEAATTLKKTVSFLNGGFTSSSLDQAASQKQFVDWFNNGDDILSSINYLGYAQMNWIGNQSDSWRFSTLILGSQSSEGAITFNFNVHVTEVKIIVQPYTKYISYTDTYNVDKNTTFIFDEEEHDLSLPSDHTGETENVTINCTPDANQNKFTIANKDASQRVFVHSFELTYLV